MDKKKWFTLGVVGTALLLIPRRSSRQTIPTTNYNTNSPKPSSSSYPKHDSLNQSSNNLVSSADKPSKEQ